jgi:hypothetical protein
MQDAPTVWKWYVENRAMAWLRARPKPDVQIAIWRAPPTRRLRGKAPDSACSTFARRQLRRSLWTQLNNGHRDRATRRREYRALCRKVGI